MSQRRTVLLHDGDIAEMHMKGSGPGGQAVNKTSNAVCLYHKPTGIQSHKTRYLEINRRDALKLLKTELDKHINGEASLTSIEELRERERKRTAVRKSRQKHSQSPTNRGSELSPNKP